MGRAEGRRGGGVREEEGGAKVEYEARPRALACCLVCKKLTASARPCPGRPGPCTACRGSCRPGGEGRHGFAWRVRRKPGGPAPPPPPFVRVACFFFPPPSTPHLFVVGRQGLELDAEPGVRPDGHAVLTGHGHDGGPVVLENLGRGERGGEREALERGPIAACCLPEWGYCRGRGGGGRVPGSVRPARLGMA